MKHNHVFKFMRKYLSIALLFTFPMLLNAQTIYEKMHRARITTEL